MAFDLGKTNKHKIFGKRTSNKATLEISGRDKQDQHLTLVRNEETLSWDFKSAETELWQTPPEPLLEKDAEFITAENSEWTGTATELAERLGVDLKPNDLTLKLNINAGVLLNDFGIIYKKIPRIHSGRSVTLKLKA